MLAYALLFGLALLLCLCLTPPVRALARLAGAIDGPDRRRKLHSFSLVTLKPAETFKTVLPSKMFEAMVAHRPIVLAVDGEARQTLESAGGGICVAPGDAAALADAVTALAQDPELRQKLGDAAAAYVACEFNREVWASRYLEILGTVSAIGPRLVESPSHVPASTSR